MPENGIRLKVLKNLPEVIDPFYLFQKLVWKILFRAGFLEALAVRAKLLRHGAEGRNRAFNTLPRMDETKIPDQDLCPGMPGRVDEMKDFRHDQALIPPAHLGEAGASH